MVRSMMSMEDLPLSFWGYVLETTTSLLNRVLIQFQKPHMNCELARNLV